MIFSVVRPADESLIAPEKAPITDGFGINAEDLALRTIRLLKLWKQGGRVEFERDSGNGTGLVDFHPYLEAFLSP